MTIKPIRRGDIVVITDAPPEEQETIGQLGIMDSKDLIWWSGDEKNPTYSLDLEDHKIRTHHIMVVNCLKKNHLTRFHVAFPINRFPGTIIILRRVSQFKVIDHIDPYQMTRDLSDVHFPNHIESKCCSMCRMMA